MEKLRNQDQKVMSNLSSNNYKLMKYDENKSDILAKPLINIKIWI